MLVMGAGTALVAGGCRGAQSTVRAGSGCAHAPHSELRPLPDGRLQPGEATLFGSMLSIAGLLVLAVGANLMAAAVALVTLVSYAFVYTPLKRRTSFSTVVGAMPGALPPVIGWAAGAGLDWTRRRSRSSRLASAGSCRTFSRSHGYIARTTSAPASRCCRSSSRTAAPRRGRRSLYAAALVPASLAPAALGLAGRCLCDRRGAPGLLFLATGDPLRDAAQRAERARRCSSARCCISRRSGC